VLQAMPYRILVVEDEPDMRDLLDFMLRGAGHRVDSVTNGRDALELLADHSYDAILSDLRMPEMTGEDLYRRIGHGWPHLAPRVVFVTGSNPSAGFQAQYRGRPVPVLTKPYTPERLFEMIEHVVARDV
jgi:two-component system NtrC family sensor kinase